MANVGTLRKSENPLELTVLEYYADTDTVHVHCREQIDPNVAHPGLLAKHLVANSKILKHKTHRLYYVVPVPAPSGTIMLLDGIVSMEVFFEWFRRNVNAIFAVIVNDVTSDLEKVVKSYVNQTPIVDLEQINHFERTIAKPFSHRPVESEVNSFDSQFNIQQSLDDPVVPSMWTRSVRSSKKPNVRRGTKNKRSKK